jgi:hypothetical protein
MSNKNKAPMKTVTNKAENVEQVKKEQAFVFTAEGFKAVNDFLVLAGESEKQGILDYKAAFHTLVARVREGIKPM